MTAQPPFLEVKSLESYQGNVRSAIRALWSGAWDYFDFFQGMSDNIQVGFTQAWTEGMRDAGMAFEDANTEETLRLQTEIYNETTHIGGLADYVEGNLKADGGKLTPLMQRAVLWGKAYERVRQLARTYAKKDKKQVWSLHPAEHCPSCLALSGKVKRASYWIAHITPKDWRLRCRQGCQCTLEDTDKPLSRGPLPGIE